MRVRLVLILKKSELWKIYSEVIFDFYLSKQKNNVHMVLAMAIFSYTDYQNIISDIEEIWLSKNPNNICFVRPKLIHILKRKFDYKLF